MTVDARSHFQQVLARLDSGEWAYCTFCGEEWNRLKACFYYRGPEKLISYLCCVCAESTFGLERLFLDANLGVSLEFHWPPALQSWKDVSPRARIMIVSYGGMKWFVFCKGMHILVQRENQTFEEARSYDNCYQAFEAMRCALLDGDNTPANVFPAPIGKSPKRDFF